MPTAIVTQSNGQVVHVRLVPSETTEDTVVDVALMAASGEATSEVTTPPNPIAAETKELAWAAGSFLVLFVLMKFFLFPRLRKSMNDRYSAIRANTEGADKVKADAQADVAEYEKALATARAEAATRIDAARQTVDNERTAQLAQVNARIATARAEADQKNAAAREAAQGDISQAVATVAARVAELAIGRAPDAAVVSAAVASAMEGQRS